MEFTNTFQAFVNSEELNFIKRPPLFKQLVNNLFRLFFIHSSENFFSKFKSKPVRKINFPHHQKKNRMMVIQQIQNKRETFFSVCIDYKIFIIQEKYYDSFLTTLKSNLSITEKLKVVDLSNKTKSSHPFFERTSFNPHQYSHIRTEITNFSQSLQLKKIKIWQFIEDVLIGFIICKGYEHSLDDSKHSLDSVLSKVNYHHFEKPTKKQERLFNESDLIFLRSLKSNQHSNEISQTDLYYYLKDQSIYVIKTWNNNNQESLKKYEKEKTFFQTFTGFFFYLPHYFGQACFEPPRPNLVIEFFRGENLQSILNNPNKRQHLSKQSKFTILLSIMACIENLHFHGYVYRDLKFDNIVTGSDLFFLRAATLIDFDACCKLPSKKCEPIDENPQYFFKEEIDYSNNIITILKIDRKTNTETFVKTISLNDNFNISSPENSQQEMSTETYVLTNDIGSNYFSSPEQRTSNKYTYTSDIYSLGKFMYYLCIGEIPNEQTEKRIKFPPEYSFLEKLYRQCTRENPSERPNISIVINKFFKLISRLNKDQQSNPNPEWSSKIKHFYLFRLTNCFTFGMNNNTYTYDSYALNMLYPIVYFLFYPCLYLHSNYQLRIEPEIEPFLSKLFFLSEYHHFERNVLNGRSLGILGRCLYADLFPPKNEIRGPTYLMEGALRNDSFAQFYLGRLLLNDTFHYNKHTFNIAMSLLEKAANTGSPKRINYLAVQYLTNASLPESISRGIELLKRSAEQYNNSEAQAVLGRWYFTQLDFNQAIYYLERTSNYRVKIDLSKIYLLGPPEYLDNEKGFYYLKLAADNEVHEAQYNLSRFYIRRKLTSEAFKYLTLASNGSSNASFLLFCLYTAGIFPQKGLEKSLKFLKSSIEQENHLALQIYAQLTRNNTNQSPDLNEYIKSIPSGRQSLTYFVDLINSSENLSNDPKFEENFLDELYSWYLFTFDYDCDIREFCDFQNLLFSIDQCYVTAFYAYVLIDCMKGDMKALEFLSDFLDLMEMHGAFPHLMATLQTLADNNNSAAQYLLASNLLNWPEYYDIPKGIHYLKAAANNNDANALYALSGYYFNGEMKKYGIPFDLKQGIMMLKKAAEKGFLSAQCDWSLMLVRCDLHLAFSYAQKAISKGCTDAYFPLGCCYIQMMTFAGDQFCQKAIECFNIAENHFSDECKAMLATIYYDGILTSKDEERSFRLYTELVNTADTEYIHNNLGVILKNGNRSVPKNIPLAIEYFETAIKQREIFALFNLSRMYFYGEGVPRNIDKAASLLSQLDTGVFDINEILNYFTRYPKDSSQICNEALNDIDMACILPPSCKHLFPPKILNSIDFVYRFDQWRFINISAEVFMRKQSKSEIVNTTFYEGLL